MIVFDLQCVPHGHRFEGWFGSSGEFTRQQEDGLVTCPTCGASDVAKAVMAPHVGRKGNQRPDPRPRPAPDTAVATPEAGPAASAPPLPAEAVALIKAIATAQAEALKSSRWVGEDFAESARAMHYGEAEAEVIHGQATAEEARELLEEGVEVAPILFPVVPPERSN